MSKEENKSVTKIREYQNPGLIFGRKKDERTWIIPKGDSNYKENSIVINVIEISNDRVRLSINAPKEKYAVYREEVIKKIESGEKGLEKKLGLEE